MRCIKEEEYKRWFREESGEGDGCGLFGEVSDMGYMEDVGGKSCLGGI